MGADRQPLRGQEPDRGEGGVPRGWKVRVGSLDTTSGGEVAEVDHYYRLATNEEGSGAGTWRCCTCGRRFGPSPYGSPRPDRPTTRPYASWVGA
ncbi:hypothetical protein NKH77_27780 [Streptomyces sp. M19]